MSITLTAPPAPLAAVVETPLGVVAPSRFHRFFTSFWLWAPLLHLACFLALLTGVSMRALILGVALYWLRMFGMTGSFHRYFAHRSYKTSRLFQFLLGWLGCMGVERGPLWWASIHRAHHKFSDGPDDVHSPLRRGFWWAHVGWLAASVHGETDLGLVKDLARYPELRWLDRYHFVPPLVGLAGCWLIAGWSGMVLGGAWSTVALWHGTFAINSLAHLLGTRRYATTDDSRNNWWLALVTMGEGWHNNHHHYMTSARQGFFWWEVDASYYVLRALAAVGLIWDVKEPPARLLAR
jgi:stearoyl-CoA desaturase (delta-9 desaturase)